MSCMTTVSLVLPPTYCTVDCGGGEVRCAYQMAWKFICDKGSHVIRMFSPLSAWRSRDGRDSECTLYT